MCVFLKQRTQDEEGFLFVFKVIPQTVLALRGFYGVAKDGAMKFAWTCARLPRSSNAIKMQ